MGPRLLPLAPGPGSRITSVTGHEPVAFVSLDETWTALRFKHA